MKSLWQRVTRLPWTALWHGALTCAGLLTVSFGGLFTYKSHFEHPKLSYIPTDDVWQQHLHQLVSASQAEESLVASPSAVLVDISGAVLSPGVYSLSEGSRVQDVVLQANGFLESADQAYIHKDLQLAKKIRDQEKIYIPFQGESAPNVVVSPEGGEREVSSGTKSLNQATQKELDAVAGIGEKRAEEILQDMPYTSWSDFEAKVSIPANILAELKNIYIF